MEAWSPDGQTILYRSRDGSSQLWALRLDDDRKPFLVYERSAGNPSFSPDGKWIAFQSSESGASQVYVAPFPLTGSKWQVSSVGGVRPQWRRDGRELYFLAPDGRLMAVDVGLGDTLEIGTPRALFQTVVDRLGGETPYAVTGDGQRFLVLVPVGSGPSDEIQVVVDWPALMKKP